MDAVSIRSRLLKSCSVGSLGLLVPTLSVLMALLSRVVLLALSLRLATQAPADGRAASPRALGALEVQAEDLGVTSY